MMFFRCALLIEIHLLLSLIFFDLVKCDTELLILHTNDMHSRFDQTDVKGKPIQNFTGTNAYGGFARLKEAVNEARAEAASQNVPSIFLNAGDTFQGTAFYTMLKDEVVSSLIRLLGIDVMSLGNHEFDDGCDTLARYLRNIDIPVVACNLNFTDEPQLQLPNLTPSKVVQIGATQIGVIGYLLPETKTTSSAGNVIFYDEIQSISKEAKRMKADGIDIIIALGHSGFEMDRRIAKSIPEVSLVIGGHTNTFLYTPPDKPPSIEKPEGPYPFIEVQISGKKVPVVQAYAYTKYLGKLWITFDDKGDYVSSRPDSNPVLLNHNIPTDSFVEEKVLEWKIKFENIIHTVLGRTNVYLDGWKSGCKEMECNLGNFITDAFVDIVAQQYTSAHGWTDAAIAIIQGGAMRSAIDDTKTEGNFTYEEVLTILPYKTPLYKVRVRGTDLKNALEQSISKHGLGSDIEKTGEFLQVSGIHVIYDVTKPLGNRVSKAEIRCANCSVPVYLPLNESASYTVIMSEYLRDGGDGYLMFKNGFSEPVIFNGTHLTDTDAVAKFFKKSEVVYPEISGRITIINDASPVSLSKSSSLINSSIITLYLSLLISVMLPMAIGKTAVYY